MKCSKNKDERYEWMTMVGKNFKREEKCEYAGANEKILLKKC